MKLKFYTIRVVFIIVVCASFGKQATAQVSGTVFRDINSNGIHDISSPQEPGEFGVTVRAYDAVNNLLGIALTDAAGAYNFSAAQVAPGVAARLEFINATRNYPSKRIAANKSNVQFVTGGSSNIDYAVASKKLLSDNNDPYMATTAATNGNALATGPGNAGDNDNLYVFPYDLSNDGGSSRRTKNQYTGSIYRLA